MNRLPLFKQLLTQLKSKNVREDYKYLGTGNPNANILIIGKEAAIDPGNTGQKGMEISSNFEQWCNLKDYDPDKIKNCYFKNHNPLYPYKGQVLKIDNSTNRGTSRTWYNYQKLYNLIYRKEGNEKIDFHEGVFISEVNSSPSPKTANADISSIEFRKEFIFRSAFIRSFPVVILAGVGYFKIDDVNKVNEIEDIFQVEFTKQYFAGKNSRQPYWIHNGTVKPKLLVNTHQLSMNVADSLLQEISELVRASGLVAI